MDLLSVSSIETPDAPRSQTSQGINAASGAFGSTLPRHSSKVIGHPSARPLLRVGMILFAHGQRAGAVREEQGTLAHPKHHVGRASILAGLDAPVSGYRQSGLARVSFHSASISATSSG
jgi:hypothetical protein